MPVPDRTDAMIARLQGELEERNAFMQGLIAGAEDTGRDLNETERNLITEHRQRIAAIKDQIEPLEAASAIALESRNRARQINDSIQSARRQGNMAGEVEYRSAAVYVADVWAAHMGDDQASQRLEVFHRAASHQTTADNPGLLPERIVGPVVNFVDASRPLVSAIGPQDLGSGSWAYAKVTQHTLVGAQTAEKTELPSRKMTITKTPITAPTYGGYVNVSKQDIRRTSPAILDMVINDLASEYAIDTETVACNDLVTNAIAGTITIPANPNPFDVSKAVWGAVGQSWAGTRGAGRPILAVSPDMMGLVGPLFPSTNPTNAYGSGFNAAEYGQGANGQISGLTVVMSAGLATGTMLVLNTAAVKCFEDRYGAMQVNEPSVWGVQVGYAGDFETVILEALGVVKIGAGV